MVASDFHVGVRTDDEWVLAALCDAYGVALVEDADAHPDYAVSTSGGPPGFAPRLLPYIARGRCPLLRSRDPRRLLRRLDVELGRVAHAVPSGTVSVRGMAALVAHGHAVLVPTPLVEHSTAVERRLRSAGVSIVEEAGLRLDPARGDIVALPGLVSGVPSQFDDVLAAGAGRWPVRGLFWSDDDLAEDERPAIALVRLLTRVEDRHELDRDTMLQGLASLVGSFSGLGLGGVGAADLDPPLTLLGS